MRFACVASGLNVTQDDMARYIDGNVADFGGRIGINVMGDVVA